MPSIQGRRKGHYLVTGPDGKVEEECETFTCGHCQRVVKAPHGQSLDDLGGFFCLACSTPCCRRCAARLQAEGGCVPFEKRMAAAERRAASLRSMGM